MSADDFMDLGLEERAGLARGIGLDLPADLSAIDEDRWLRIARAVERRRLAEQRRAADDDWNDDEERVANDEEDTEAFWYTEGEFDGD